MGSKFAKEFFFRFPASFSGIFNLVKNTKMIICPISPYVGSPFLGRLAPSNTFNSRCVGVNSANIHHVLGFAYFPKVFPPIVAWVLIYVVNLIGRPFTSHYSPCNSMRFVKTAFYADQNTTFRGFTSGNIANMNSLAVSFFPKQQSRFWVIIKHFTKLFRCHHA